LNTRRRSSTSRKKIKGKEIVKRKNALRRDLGFLSLVIDFFEAGFTLISRFFQEFFQRAVLRGVPNIRASLVNSKKQSH
jgi:hypothetical protein